MSCNGPCQQGRKPCPTPVACESPIYDGGMELLGMLFVYLMGIATGVLGAIIFL